MTVQLTPQMQDKIVELLSNGQSMRQICQLDDMPSRATMLRWLAKDTEFEAKCARAREDQADFMDDLILEAANNCDETNAQSTRVKIAAYQWRASKLKPKKYGDKIQNETDMKVEVIVRDLTRE